MAVEGPAAPEVEAIRTALRCGQPRCGCARPRGPVHCPHPDHPDAHPSFDVDEKDGRVLVYCQSRHCPQDEVIEALRARGLWEGEPPAPALSRLRRGVLEGPLNDAARFIEQYVVMPSDAAVTATALWIAHTYVLDAFDVTPYLLVQSAEKQSGKTRLLEVLELLTPRAWRVVQPSEAVLFRKIAKDHPVLLLDEADAIFRSRDERAEPLRAVLNAGHRRGATVPRCVGEGSKMQLVDFDVFCPKAVASIGDLPDTITDRGIIIRLDRATPAEQRRIRRLRFREAEAEAAPIREGLKRWAEAALPKLREARPALPEALDGRAADSWEPLLAVAEQAGDGWYVLAWDAALALSTGAGREDDSVRVRLLADIRRVFEEREADRLATADLIEGLCEDDSTPWGDWHGRQVTPQALARLLRPFRINPTQWREGDRGGIRGYTRAAFADAFARYVASEPLQPLQPNNDAGFSHFEEPLQTPPVAVVENGGNTDGACIVAGVAVQTPYGGEEAGDGELVTPEDLAKAGGAGQFTLRVGQATGWRAYSYAPGRAVAAGKSAWLAFVRGNPEAEIARAAAEMATDPALTGGPADA